MEADLGRYDDWLTWLRGRAAADPDLLVAWVGGSAATGGYDEHSDLDVEVLCTPGTAVRVYGDLVAAEGAPFTVHSRWELPASTYPDGRQAFLHLRDEPGRLDRPTRIIDLHVSDLGDAHRFVDVRRHGTPVVVHDPDGLLELRHDDEEAMRAAIAEAVEQVRQRRPSAEWLVRRAARRGDRAEASLFLLRFGIEPLVRLLRVRHCPWRHDFGLRYLRTDLPDGLAARVEALLPGDDLAGLQARADACFAWTDELLAVVGPEPGPGQSVPGSASSPSARMP